jgi:hypothetical protein
MYQNFDVYAPRQQKCSTLDHITGNITGKFNAVADSFRDGKHTLFVYQCVFVHIT